MSVKTVSFCCIIKSAGKDNTRPNRKDSSHYYLMPWPHQASASALTLASMLENGCDADARCGLYRYKLMWAITSVHADARCGQGLTV